MNSDHLIGAARRILRLKGRPREVDLRRAVSDCYYALFHALAGSCADSFVGVGKRGSDTYVQVYRSLDHTAAKRVLTREKDRADRPRELRDFAALFVMLQDLRHQADYDPRPFRRDRLELTVMFENAETILSGLKRLSPDLRTELAAILLLKTRP